MAKDGNEDIHCIDTDWCSGYIWLGFNNDAYWWPSC
jgi:hypothetical protein